MSKTLKEILHDKELTELNKPSSVDEWILNSVKEWLLQKRQEKTELIQKKDSLFGKRLQAERLAEINELLLELKK